MQQTERYLSSTTSQVPTLNGKVVEIQQGIKKSFYIDYIKRCCDIIISFVMLVILSPLLLITALLVKLTSKGPIIFKQQRLGVGGKPFIIYKFRSMRTDAEKDGPMWANKQDNRTTVFGGFLRKYHIDELPQLFNIIKGDMSFVGPRPEREYFYNKFEEFIPDFRSRLRVKPGLTGLAQVNGGYEIGPEEKIKYDKEYIHKVSFKMDILIIFKTAKVVLKGENAR